MFDILDNLVPRNQVAISRNRDAIQKVYGHYPYFPLKCGDSIAKVPSSAHPSQLDDLLVTVAKDIGCGEPK